MTSFDFTATPPVQSALGSGTLYRALRDDVDFAFVVIGADGDYEVVHEDGVAEGTQGVTLINPFEVPQGEDERFLAAWEAAREVMAGRQGYQGTRLHRAAGPAQFRFVNVARWSSPLAFAKATGLLDFRQLAAEMPFASHPALYEVIRG